MPLPDLTEQALAAIDAANAPDPREVDYGRAMSRWLARLRPDAPDTLRIAVRAQHIRRWEIPRDTFPMDRSGYLRWRKTLYGFHAEKAGEILEGLGFEPDKIERVQFLLQKRQLNRDVDTQTLEDCACLVFLELHADDFERRTDEDKMIDILRKTWGKMSAQARDAALAMEHSPRMLGLIQRALANPDAPSA